MSLKSAPVLAVLVVILIGPNANAATVLEFEPPGATVGERVTGITMGAGMTGILSGRVVVLLAPSQRVADTARGPKDARLVRFGVMTADEKDVGHFTATVPNVEAGSYIAVAYCRGCIEGGSLFTVGEFEVTGAVLPRTGRPLTLWTAVGMTLVIVGRVVLRKRDGI